MPGYYPEGDASQAQDGSTRVLHKMVSQYTPGTGGGNTTTYSGVGSPEGSQTASPYDRYVDTATGYEWRKDSGTDTNTGWTRVL